VLLGVKWASTSVITQPLASHQVTAVLTATSSTVMHSHTTRRTSHAYVARFDFGLACIC
jgi:hypothetical protein